MKGINLVIIVGTLGSNPDVKEFENGDKIATISVATEKWSKKEEKAKTTWNRVVVKGSAAKYIATYAKQGQTVVCVGSNTNRQWEDDNGETRFITEVECWEAQLISPKSKDDTPAPSAPEQG